MNEIIEVKLIEAEGGQLVNARELWERLESKRQFADWIKAKVLNNPFFEEGMDYKSLLHKSVKQTRRGGHNRVDYALTIDAAKKVAMSEQTPRGNKVRDYFIKCEKALKEVVSSIPDFSNPAEAARAWADEYEKKQKALEDNRQLLIENSDMKPKAEFYDDVAGSKNAIELGKVAKIIGIKNLGRNKLFEFLRENKILMRGNIPYQRYIDAGYFRTIEQKYNKPDGTTHISIKTLVYQKGVDYILKLLKKNKEEL